MRLSGRQATLIILAALALGGAGLWLAARMLQFTLRSSVTEKAWRTHLAEVVGNSGDVLEVGTIRNEETLEKRTEYEWWGIYLGTNYSRIRVPVTYRYHILVSGTWELAVKGNVLYVRAPPLMPSLPPAIHTEGLERYSERGWARFDSAEHLEALEQSLTGELSARASDPAHIGLVRDVARGSIAEFAKKWLVQRGDWNVAQIGAVVVRFPGEDPSSGAASKP